MPKRKVVDSSDEDDEFTIFEKPVKVKKPTVAEQNAAKYKWNVGRLIRLFERCRSCDRDIVRRLNQGQNNQEQVDAIELLDFIDYNYQCERYYKTATSQYRHKHLQTDMWTLLSEVKDHLKGQQSEFIDEAICEDLLYDWFKRNGINSGRFIRELYGVLAGTHGKKNTFYVQGDPNAGKTFLFSLPIEYLMGTVGRIVTINTGDRFVFENCMNQRLISIEECAIPPQHIEEMKKLMGGEHLQIDIKNQREGGAITKTPVICSSNSPPWSLVMGQEAALRARMYYYTVSGPFDVLADFIGKKFNPIVWAYLLRCAHDFHQQDVYNRPYHLLHEEYKRFFE